MAPSIAECAECAVAAALAWAVAKDELAAGREPAMARAAVLELAGHLSVTPAGRPASPPT